MSGRKGGRLAACVLLFVGGFLMLSFAPGFSGLPPYLDMSCVRLAIAGLLAGAVALMGGAASLAPTSAGLRSALREGFYPVGVSLAVAGLSAAGIADGVASGEVALAGDWARELLGTALLCLSVGLFEELLCRVVLLGGLLARFGGTKNGVFMSALVSSVAFGAVHVVWSVGDPGFLMGLQMLLKTVQAGLVGLILAAVYVRTRSFWGVVLLHALADFFPMLVLGLLGGVEETVSGGYVSSGTDLVALAAALALVVAYVPMNLVYAPAAVKAARLLDGVCGPELGPLEPGWEAREVPPAGAGAPGGLPVPPEGFARPAGAGIMGRSK